jgi:hypothetical protein
MRRGRARDDRGATLLEAAIITPVLLLVILGIFEFGLIFRDTLTINDAVGVAARSGAVQGPDVLNNETADFSMIEDLREGTNALPVSWIDRIVIFDADAPGAGEPTSQVPQACKTGNNPVVWRARKCNVYNPLQAFYAVQQGNTDFFKCINPTDKACGFNPETRVEDPLTPALIDYVGVYIAVDREQITKMFGNTWSIEEAAVARLEPGGTG